MTTLFPTQDHTAQFHLLIERSQHDSYRPERKVSGRSAFSSFLLKNLYLKHSHGGSGLAPARSEVAIRFLQLHF